MDRDRDRSGSINCLPYFDGEDYTPWRVMMQAFLYSQDENIWNIVENGWVHPTKPVDSKAVEGSNIKLEPKPRSEWSTIEVRDYKERKRIGTCKTAKKAWDLLRVTYEGNKRVRAQKLQRLNQEFENMNMRDDESIDDFHTRLIIVTSECESLGDPFEEHRVVKKFLRSLPKSFQSKQTAIEEVQDLHTYSLDELLGNLQTFEMKIKPDRKIKTIALNAVKKEKEDDSEFTAKDFALLSKQFKKFVKSGKSFQEVKNSSGSKSFSEKPKCFECQGFGHLAVDCGNKKYKARSSKAMKSTWSDSESETHSGNEEENFALTAALHSNSSCESEDDEHDDEVWADKYEEMCVASTKMIKINENLKKILELVEGEKKRMEEQLQSQEKSWEVEKKSYVDRIQALQDNLNTHISLGNSLASEKLSLETDLQESQHKLSQFSIGSEKVNKMINMGKRDGDKRGLGFDSGGNVNISKVTKFVKSSELSESKVQSPPMKFVPLCHHCGMHGHIRPRCNKLRRTSQNFKAPQRSMHSQSLKAKLREHLREVNRIANLVSIPCHLCRN